MMIRSATALRNDYDGMVKLSTEKQEPIYLTRSGDGEMVFLPIALWEKRQAELQLFADMLRRSKPNSPVQEHIPQARCAPMWRMSFVRVEWLNAARNEFLTFLKYYKSRRCQV